VKIGNLSHIFLIASAVAITSKAAPFDLQWFTVDGGGGTSASNDGRFSVSGTVGQPDAGSPAYGGNYSLIGGFWSIYAVQTPGGPLLSIQITNNSAMIYWPSPSPGWTLQETTNSVSGANWIDHPFPQDNGTIKFIVIDSPTGNRFYRLKSP